MTPRLAQVDDLNDIVAIHLQAWDETYPGLLPQSEFDRHNREQRLRIWGNILRHKMPVSYLPGVGFAHMGRHRDPTLRGDYPVELYSFYVLKDAHGAGAAQALLAHAIGDIFVPFTAEVLETNARAMRFYAKLGGQRLRAQDEVIDGMTCTHVTFGYPVPIQLEN
ncbi:MAG: GNAT family N-acetyltransferase [Pseudomonadota bacterium]